MDAMSEEAPMQAGCRQEEGTMRVTFPGNGKRYPPHTSFPLSVAGQERGFCFFG